MTMEGISAAASVADATRPASPSLLYAAVAAQRAPMRVAMVVPLRVPAWLGAFLVAAAQCDWLDVTVVLAETSPQTAEGIRVPADLRIYLAGERLRRHGDDGMLAALDIAECARATRSCLLVSDAGPPALLAGIDNVRPDLVMLVGDAATATTLSTRAAFGCWRIGADLSDPHLAALSLLAPLLKGELATDVDLQLDCSDGPHALPLAAGNSATRAGSFALQREQALRKVPALLLRGLRDLHAGRLQVPTHADAHLRLAGDAAQAFVFGDGMRAFFISARNTVRWWRQLWRGEDPWFLALRREPVPLDPAAPVVGRVASLLASPGRYWADPCIVDSADARLLFVEEYGYQDSRGVIACLNLAEDGSVQRLGVALDEAHHLSYPQVFDWQGEWFMTVESGAARRARLYKAASFPLFWEPVTDLLSGCLCVDPTLHHHDGRWYLFANVSESGPGNTCDELFLFVADSLVGPYRPHPANPVVCDVRRARPAGRLFTHAGRLIRPAQDCTPDYGAAIVFNEVLELSPDAYSERPIGRVDPTWMQGLWGCHTYSAMAGREVIDARGHPAPGSTRTDVLDTPIATRGLRPSVPVVSVLVPVYNGERFLAQAIESALAQTLRDIEILVVDDGSTDTSAQIADRFADLHPDRVRVIHQVNQGLPLARNSAIAVARGRYLALLDADDVWLPSHLAASVEVLERNPMIGLVHANAQDIDGDGRRINYGSEPARWGPEERDAYAAILLRRQHVSCPTAVFRSSVVANVGAFDPAFNRLGCEDRDLWLRIAEASNLAYLDQSHAQYRIHGANMSANSERMWRARLLLVRKYADRPRGKPLRRRALAAIDADLGHELALSPNPVPAIAAFAKALLRDPLRVDAWKGLIRRIIVGRRSGVIVPR